MAGTQLFQHTVLTAFLTVVSREAKRVPLFTRFPQIEPSLPSLCGLSPSRRFLPISHAFSLGLLPILVSSLALPLPLYPHFLFSLLPASRVSPLFDTTVSSRSNRFPQLTAPPPVPGLRLPSNAQSGHPSPILPRYHPSPAGRERTAGGRRSELTA